MNRVVVHYHEIALKRGNRPAFVNQLVDNIGRALRGTGVKRIRALAGRIVVNLTPHADWPEISRRLQRVFGIANFALSWRAERDIDAITATVLEAIDGRQFSSFAVRAKRADKGFHIPSPEIGRLVGSAVVERSHAKVDLRNPELTINVEVVQREAFVGLGRVAGPGGLPVGASGTVLALLSGGIDSPVAAWRMMRRGCQVAFVHFHGAPYQDRTSRDKVMELAQLLTPYQLDSRLYLVAFGEIQRQIVTQVARPFRVVLYRRMMMRIAEALAASTETRALALVTGESLGQVASQTLSNLTVTEEAVSIPVLRPLIGMDKAEITAQAQQIGSFEISIQPDQDCCQLFIPRHPATRSTVPEIHAAEQALDIPALVRQGLESVTVSTFASPAIRATAASEQTKAPATC
ncbi:MAG: thiI [Deltaproteobacteria bacterium]|nr:thiI [Deltaproteobacteria bacterium]